MPSTVRITKEKKPRRLSFADRREAKHREEELIKYGAVLGDISSNPTSGRFFLCFVRAVLIFMASFGMLGGLVSSFGLAFSMPVVIIALFLLAFLTAFLYYNKLTFYLGYFVIFAAFIFFSVSFYWEVNSGYTAFLSEVFKKYSDFLHVATPDTTEFISDRYLTVTMAMIFMGWFFSILLNITISGYMDIFTTFLITFLPLQIAFYVDIVPPLPYVMMLLAVYIAVAILGRSGRFTLPYKSSSNKSFSRQRAKKYQRHTYYASSKGMLQVGALSVALATAFLLICGSLFYTDFNTKNVSNKVKDATDDLIKKYLDGGIASLFDRYDATGGLAHGRLGGISNVSPDFETDLVVRFVPNHTSSLYLKAFTGVNYNSSTFSPAAVSYPEDTNGSDEDYLTAEQLTAMETCLPVYSSAADNDDPSKGSPVSRMYIENIDADTEYEYRPYFTLATSSGETGEKTGLSAEVFGEARSLYAEELSEIDMLKTSDYTTEEKGFSYSAAYLPFTEMTYYAPNPYITKEYQDSVYDIYLQIPDDIKEDLHSFCEEAGLYEAASYYPSLADGEERPLNPDDESGLARYTELQKQRLGIASTLKKYFAANFQYTMRPGATPRRRDVVTYFLYTQKRGYCAHFASSTTMLLRSMGIPTRYIEGYMMTMTDVMGGHALSNTAEGWQTPSDTVSSGTGVLEVELTDGSAHAWVEIYLDGYGWIPFDTTPPSDDAPIPANWNLINLFSGLFTTTNRNTGNNDTIAAPQLPGGDNSSFSAFFKSISFLLKPLGILFAALAVFILSFPLIRLLREEYRIFRYCKNRDYSKALLIYYRRFIKKLISRKVMALSHPTVRDSYELMITSGVDGEPVPKEEAEAVRLNIEKAAYGRESVSEGQFVIVKEILKRLGRKIKKKRSK